jgi:hypothetical protein
VHKGRRWRLNIKVKERPVAEGSSDCKFYKPSKIMVLFFEALNSGRASHCNFYGFSSFTSCTTQRSFMNLQRKRKQRKRSKTEIEF